jgi:DNA-binding MarR family transcriptional regulator
LNNEHQRDNYIASKLITQQGIKNILDCDLSLISRILKRNEDDGNIHKRLSKIENKKRKQYIYFLTEKGAKIALEITKLSPDFVFDSKNNSYFNNRIDG